MGKSAKEQAGLRLLVKEITSASGLQSAEASNAAFRPSSLHRARHISKFFAGEALKY